MVATLGFTGILQLVNTGKYLPKRNIFVRIVPLNLNQLYQHHHQQQQDQTITTSLRNNLNQK